MKEEHPFQELVHVERSSKKSGLIIVFFVVLFLVIAALGGYYFWSTQMQHQESAKQVAPEPTRMPIESPTQTATTAASVTPKELERNALEVAVLNGSGISGAAQGVSATLTKLGYTIKTVGNADGFAYTGITVRIKKSKEAYLPLLKKDLEADTSGKEVSTSVTDDVTTDAEVIVGR